MPSKKPFTAVVCLLLISAAFGAHAQAVNSNGVEPRVHALEDRVDALEELTIQQQGEIDQNAADIEDLQNAGGGGGGGPAWAVIDDDGQEVGTLISVGDSFRAVVELSAGAETFLVTTGRDGIQQFSQTLYYTSGDCTADGPGEEVFTSVYIDEMQNVAIFVEPGDPESRVAYQVSDTETSADISSASVGGGCSVYQGGPFTFDVLPVSPISGDLSLVYPAPFRLVKP